MNSLILLVMGPIVSLLFFYKDRFGIELTKKVEMPVKHRNQTLTFPLFSFDR